MSEISLNDKLKKYNKYVKDFISKNKSGVEDIHKLRVKSRELFSLMDQNDPFFKRIKKVIKLSNKVRDLDVFFEVYLKLLPKKLINKLDMKSIVSYNKVNRDENVEKLHSYLELFLDIPKSVKFIYEEKEFETFYAGELSLNQKKLHKYRIYIKKILYKEKNSYPIDKTKIELLTKVKDLLGSINDNYNALKRLESYNIKESVLEDIKDYTNTQNNLLFQKFKRYNEEVYL